MVRVYSLIILLVTLFSCSWPNRPEGNSLSDYPDRIMLNLSGDPATERVITWRTSARIGKSYAQYAIAGSYVPDSSEILQVKGEVFNRHPGLKPYKNHRVTLSGLKPSTRYLYRVGNGTKWSEWIQFTTASKDNLPFSFLYLGDLQNSIRSDCSWVVRQAYSHFLESHFILFTGDLVNKTINRDWQEFYNTGRWIFSSKPSLATPGNHEFRDWGIIKNFPGHWNQFFYFPQNGPEKFRNRMYYIDYQGVRFISLDSYSLINFDKHEQEILNWLTETLQNNTSKWTVLMTHYPVFSCTHGRNNPGLRQKLLPIIEKFGIDLVLQGHDHTYCRGRNQSEKVEIDKSPVYVVSVAGPKANTINPLTWADRAGSKMQLYQHIRFSGDSLIYSSWTANQKLFDAFTLIKNRNSGQKILSENNSM